MSSSRITTVAIVLAFAATAASAQSRSALTSGYRNAAQVTSALDSLRQAHQNLIAVTEIGRSPGGRPLSVVRLGAGANVDNRPAVLVIANAHGPHVVGSEIAVRAIAQLARGYGRDTAVTRLLDRVTFYVVPRANPDAAEALFGNLPYERNGNDLKADDDRDEAVDEDGPNDLNGDGIITMMRIADPAGPWMVDPVNPALMRRADQTKGEVGRYRLLVEGLDDDRDEDLNEDGAGGTDVARNFPHNYEWFATGVGSHQISTPESRALAELFRNHMNIAAVYVLGPQDNLIKLWDMRRMPGISGNPQGTSEGGPFSAALPEDEPWYSEVSRRFKRATGWNEGPASADYRGDPVSFSYFVMGRFAFGSRGWWIPKMPPDTGRSGPRPEQPDPLADERNALAWLKANRPEGFVDWREQTVPGLEGKKVEVGGFAPGALLNPPARLLDSVAAKHTAFLSQLGTMMPAVALRELSVESLGNRVYRISAQVANDGFLPTLATIGSRVRWPQRVKVELVTSRGQTITAGQGVQLLGPIPGSGSSVAMQWVVVGDPGSTVTVKVSSPVAGSASQTLTLRAR